MSDEELFGPPIVRGTKPCLVCHAEPGQPHVPQEGDGIDVPPAPNRPTPIPLRNRPESEL